MFWTSVGHILGFGHIFGHIMDTFGDFASKMCPSLHRAPVPVIHPQTLRCIEHRTHAKIGAKFIVPKIQFLG